MTALGWVVVIVVAWVGIDILLLAINRERVRAGERFDQVLAAHYRDNENPEGQRR